MSRIPRLAVLWCPHWPVVVAGAQPGEQVAVLHANRVVAHSLAAGEEGVAVGMRRREAQARCPHVRIEPYEPERDARVFDAVAAAVAAKVPRVELTEPGTLTFVARGPARYFGGEAAMAAMIAATAAAAAATTAGDSLGAVDAVGGFGIGVADGRFAAGLAAREAVARRHATSRPEVVVVPAGVDATRRFLAPITVQSLVEVAGVDPGFVHLLHRLGLHRLEAVAALPEADLVARFGPLGAFAHRLAAGGDDRLPGTYDPPAGHQVQQIFDDPVHHSDALVFVARQLADEMVSALAAEGRVCTRLLVLAETEHGERSERLWYRGTGLNVSAIVERVRWQLDGWARDAVLAAELTAGVTRLRLEPVEVRADEGVQQGFWGGRTQADDWAVRAVARLAGLVGEQQVLVPSAGGGRHPNEAYGWVPAITADLLDPSARCSAPPTPWPGRLPVPSPAVVHARALPVDVLDAVGKPVAVSGRGVVNADPAAVRVEGTTMRVTAWAGPWPVDERWWDTGRARRVARMQVLVDDQRVLLVSVERGQWWLAAEYA